MPSLHVRLLGDFHIVYGDRPLMTLDSARLQSLLAYVLLHRAAPQSRRHLAFVFYPDSTEPQARSNLRKLLHDFRLALPDAEKFLDVQNQTLQWRMDAPLTLDVAEFEDALSRAVSIEELENAVALYRGDLLPSCYDEWIVPERERLRQLFINALERLVEFLESRRDDADAITFAQRLLQFDRLREETYRTLMRLYALSGDRAAALETYQTCVARLQRELGVEPSVATREEYQRLLRPQEIPSNLPKPLSSFVGRERELVEVKQLLFPLSRDEGTGEGARSAGGGSARLLTLMGPGGIGKTRLSLEVASDILRRFNDGAWFVELAPLSDPQLVEQTVATVLTVREEAGRSLLTTLTNYLRAKHLLLILDNCEHVIEACARLAEALLRACAHLRILATSREPLGLSGETTFRVPSLTVLDPQALPPIENLVQYEASRMFIERAKTVLPSFAATEQNASALAQVCYRLDGMPLAIELAAARVAGLSLNQIAARLDDRFHLLKSGTRAAPPRHQSLQAVLDWSYELLSEAERALFRRLSVFIGGWTLEAAEAICKDEGGRMKDEAGSTDIHPSSRASHVLHPSDVLDLLLRLVNKSLVVAEGQAVETRYRLLETIRQYAHERLKDTDEADGLHNHHFEFFLHLAEEAEPQLRGAQQAGWLNRLEVEHDNLRAALAWSLERGRADEGFRLAAALGEFWSVHGHLSEGRQALSGALTSSGAQPTPVRAKALNWSGTLALGQGDYPAARALFEQSLAIWRQLNDELGLASTLNSLGGLAWSEGEYTAARSLFEQSLALSRELGNKRAIGSLLNNLGLLAYYQGDYTAAHSLFEESLALSRELGYSRGMAVALNNLGFIAFNRGDYELARARSQEGLGLGRELGDKSNIVLSLTNLGLLASIERDYRLAGSFEEESLRLSRELGDKRLIGLSLLCMGYAALAQGDYAAARTLNEDSLAIFREMGHTWGAAVSLGAMGLVACLQGDYASARACLPESIDIRRKLGDKGGVAGSLEALANLATAEGKMERGVRLFGAAQALRETIGLALLPVERELHDRSVPAAREPLGEEKFVAAWAAGRAMELEEAIAYALTG